MNEPAHLVADEAAGEAPTRGLLDTNVVILRRWIDPSELPDEVAISVITLAELSAGHHLVREGDAYDVDSERARRVEVLQRAEHEFDPIPLGTDAARVYGRLTAAVAAIGRTPRRRLADLLIAATAVAEGLPVYTTNPTDYAGLGEHVTVVPVTLPPKS